MKRCAAIAAVAVVISWSALAQPSPPAPEYGPAKGALVIAGGGSMEGTPYKEGVILPWLKRGITNVKMLHTHDPKVARSFSASGYRKGRRSS